MYADHLASLEETRKVKVDRMKAVHKKSVDEGRSMETGETEEFETIKNEIKAIDADIARTKDLMDIEAADLATAKPVDGTTKAAATVTPTRPLGNADLTLRSVEKLEPGIAFARYGMCVFAAKGDHSKAFQLAQKHYPQTESIVKTLKAQSEGANLQEMMRLKTSIAAGTTTDSTWAAP